MTGTERKVFQKYYPPDFDPSKIPKGKGGRNRQFVQRVMAPFNMQCNTCHEYIYKGKKFNMRRETAEGESYLGLKIFRFYFRCPNCLAEISFKTDIENVDYQMEQGAMRLFEAFKYYQEQEKEKEQQEEQEKADPMKMLEKRTQMSRTEMEAMGKLEELQEANRRGEKVNALDYLESLEKRKAEFTAQMIRLQEEDDEEEIRRIFGKTEDGKIIKRIADEEDEEDNYGSTPTASTSKASSVPKPGADINSKPQGKRPIQQQLAGLVKKRPKPASSNNETFAVPKLPQKAAVSAHVGPSSSSSLLGLASYGSGSDSD
jgi:hypothetical protein